MVMTTVRELFSANPVIPFIFSSFCPGGGEDYFNVAQILLCRLGIAINGGITEKNVSAET
jgi:hypothetical protein